MSANVKMTEDHVRQVLRTIQALAQKQVLIGIPDATTDRENGGAVTNAELGYLHEFGSPSNNIPARPFLIPGVTKSNPAAAVLLRQGAEKALDASTQPDGQTGKPVDASLDRAGLLASNAVKRLFTDDNGWAPNAPSTSAQKGSDRPLIDTGQMRRAITYAVVKKDGQQNDA